MTINLWPRLDTLIRKLFRLPLNKQIGFTQEVEEFPEILEELSDYMKDWVIKETMMVELWLVWWILEGKGLQEMLKRLRHILKVHKKMKYQSLCF